MRTLLLLFLLNLSTTFSMALDVFVINPVPSACGFPTGVLEVIVSGGVPPYAVLWSTGATTETLTGLAPGIYQVSVADFEGTQALGLGEVYSQSMMTGGQTLTYLAHCSGGYPYADLTLHNTGQFGVPIWGQGPYTITGPASVVSSTDLLCVNCQNMDSLVRVEMDVPPGSAQTITWQDANGCPGESTVIMSTEAIWPQVMVTDIVGACAGGSNGGFTITIDPGSQYFVAKLYRPNGSLLNVIPQAGSPTSQNHATLVAGDYQLHVLPESFGPTDDEQCGDLITITVPDLGADCGNVNGRVFIDGNDNCLWTPNENSLRQAIVEFTPGPYYASTTNMGLYSTNLPLGTYDHTVIHPAAQQECPGPFTVTAGGGSVNEAIGCSSLFPLDVQVTMANGPARPGFEFEYVINAVNNTVANAGATILTLEFDANLSYVSASPAPFILVGNTLTWNLTGVSPNFLNNFHVYFTVAPDMGLIGTLLNSTATLTTTNTDSNPANNTWNSAQLVTASYDPNDKVARTSTGTSDELYYIDQDEYIDYTIRFQNTGTDTAFLVVITDTLPATLDPASIQVGAASHPFNWNLAGPGIVTFNFVNIQLPDSNVNEAASHGFVAFRIRPRMPLLPGTVIENIANIYFDYNEPVITEPSVLVAEFSTGVAEHSHSEVHLVPNPAIDRIGLSDPVFASSSRLWSIRTMDGRAVLGSNGPFPVGGLDIGALAAGVYIVQVGADGRSFKDRFIKLDR